MQDKTYLELIIETSSEDNEQLIAHLSSLRFDGFLEEEDSLKAYIPRIQFTPEIKLDTMLLLKEKACTFQYREIEYQNWNALWESNFSPVTIDENIRIRASFHKSDPSYGHEIIIDPKMAFGTGHHETTAGVLKMMQLVPLKGKTVLDFGCGTGILGIYACMIGVKLVEGIEITPEAVENCQENIDLNGSTCMTVREGNGDNLPKGKYDILLCNVNRNVLLDKAEVISSSAAKSAYLFTSGYLDADKDMIRTRFEAFGFVLKNSDLVGKWVIDLFER